jgi:hypothetical protein
MFLGEGYNLNVLRFLFSVAAQKHFMEQSENIA